MIERVHEHIVDELQQNARTDTVFVVVAILLNLITLGINTAVASGRGATQTIVMFIFTVLVIVVNFVVEVGLIKGRQMRVKLLSGLLKMYKDQNVEGYYDPSLLTNYSTRYNLFMLVVVCTGLVAIIVPFIIR
ncbi:MAG: hypothetical protein V1894_02115 [Chloroflexota bacterium]